MFNELIVSGQTGDMAQTHKPWSIGLSVILQAGILGALLLIPLIYTQVLPKAMLSTFLVAPPPPPPPPPPQQAVVKQVQPAKVLVVNKMAAPTVIPKKIEIAKDEAPPAVNPNDMQGVAGDSSRFRHSCLARDHCQGWIGRETAICLRASPADGVGDGRGEGMALPSDNAERAASRGRYDRASCLLSRISE